MPLPRWLKACWQGTHFCGRCLFTLMHWLLWIGLTLLAGVQIFILTSREVDVPYFVLREVEEQLADAGLLVTFGEFTFDPLGRLLVRDAQLSLLSSETQIIKADAVYLEVDPLALWMKEIKPSEIRLVGVDLLIPAVISPTGQAQPIAKGINANMVRGESERDLILEHFTARLGPLMVSASGAGRVPISHSVDGPPFHQMLQSFAQTYLQASRVASDLLPRLPAMEGAKLDLVLTPDETRGVAMRARASATSLAYALPSQPGAAGHLRDLRLTTSFTPGAATSNLKLTLDAGEVAVPDFGDIQRFTGHVELAFDPTNVRFTPRQLTLRAETVSAHGVTLSAVSGHALLTGLPRVQAHGIARVGGGDWAFQGDLDATNAEGLISLQGTVGAETLEIAVDALNFDVPSILSWSEQPFLRTELVLAPGGRPVQATADFMTGPVVARYVPLDATAAHVTWHDQHLRADQILLRRGESLAFGSYEMDFDDLDFQFLLNGRLEPSDINGWFRDWWPSLFAMFEFPVAPPEANVEVSGRWKAPLETQVFVSADARETVVKGIPMERMRTRLYVRPGWVDVLSFIAEREIGTVAGRFARQWKLPDSRRWTKVEIHAAGRSDLAPVPQLLPRNGAEIIAPFDFTTPLDMRLEGEISREDWDQPIHENFVLTGQTTGDWTYKDFPLQGVEFHAKRLDDVTLIDTFTTGFAGGELEGKIELRGTGDDQRLAFDVNLDDALLGRTIHDVSHWTAQRRGETKAPETTFEKQMADGKLTVSLTAEGPADDPFDLQGLGSAAVSHPDLANINLLGVLSGLLKRTVLNFSTLQLNHANADFELKGPQVIFPQVKITGNRGALDANGTYSLDTQLLDFSARIRPFEGGEGLLDAVFTPFSSVLEVKLAGELSDPEWTFVFGPTNILRNLTGENNRAKPPPASPPSDSTATPPEPPATTTESPAPIKN